MIGAIIGAGASLLGGALNRSAQRDANRMNRPTVQVKEWEAAGINPLFGISSGGYIPHQTASIGDSFSQAGSHFLRALELDHDKDVQKTKVEQENSKLKKKLDDLAKPVEPSNMAQYGALMPLPSQGDFNAGSEVSRQDILVDGVRADGPQSDASRRLHVTTPLGTLKTDPRWTPASQFEDEFGELAGLLYSGVRAADIFADVLAKPVGRAKDAYFDHVGEPFSDWMMSIGTNQGVVPTVKKSAAWGNSPRRSISPTQKEIDDFRYSRNAKRGY